MAGVIFISCQRDDCQHAAGRLAQTTAKLSAQIVVLFVVFDTPTHQVSRRRLGSMATGAIAKECHRLRVLPDRVLRVRAYATSA